MVNMSIACTSSPVRAWKFVIHVKN
jgi:hypothetical protein